MSILYANLKSRALLKKSSILNWSSEGKEKVRAVKWIRHKTEKALDFFMNGPSTRVHSVFEILFPPVHFGVFSH